MSLRHKLLLPLLVIILNITPGLACDNPRTHLDAGDSLFNQGSYDKAILEYSLAVEVKPASSISLHNRGRCYLHLADYNQAITDFTRAIDLDTRSARTYYLRSLAFSALNNMDAAITDMDKAVNLDENVTREMETGMATAYYNLGVACKQRGRTIFAQAFLGAAIRSDEKMVDAYMERADFYLFTKYYDLAILDLNKAIALKPDFALAFMQRGFAYLQKNELNNALSDLNKAVALDSSSSKSHLYRGRAYYLLNDYVQSGMDLERAVNLDGKYPLAYLYRGYLYQATGKLSLALADFNHVTQIATDPATLALAEQEIARLKTGQTGK